MFRDSACHVAGGEFYFTLWRTLTIPLVKELISVRK
jgi:hypothetical protein